MIAAGREATLAPDATAQTVLWAIWSATGLSDRWRDAALGGEPSVRAVTATWTRSSPSSAPPRRSSTACRGSAVGVRGVPRVPGPPRGLARGRAAGTDSVAALTPAGAAGREWDVVVVAGVQDGVWPDLRLRDSLLGSQALVELLAGAPRTRTAWGRTRVAPSSPTSCARSRSRHPAPRGGCL
ncbi:hypothetical protein NKG05_03870 [Oerskovia sp. M15]